MDAVAHAPEWPHDATSLYYQVAFSRQHGRVPTWADALAHCAAPMREAWTSVLETLGIDCTSPHTRGPSHA